MVNFDEVRRAQIAKFTPLTYTLGPLGSFKVCSDAKEREWGAENTTGSYRTHSFLVKLEPSFQSLRWKTCLWVELQPWCMSLQ